MGLDNIKSIEPEKNRIKPTLNFYQKNFHLAQRSVASKGYFETVTWSFTDENLNDNFKEEMDTIKIVNPISSDLNVLRNSLYPNLLDSVSRNYAKGFDAFAMFEIGHIFRGIDYSNQEKFIGLVLSGYQTKKNEFARQYQFSTTRKNNCYQSKIHIARLLMKL